MPPHKHSYKTNTVPATCTENGYTKYTCECGKSYTEAIKTKGTHTYGKYIYNNDATTDADGTETRTCSVCKKTETRTVEGTKIVIYTFADANFSLHGSWTSHYVYAKPIEGEKIGC